MKKYIIILPLTLLCFFCNGNSDNDTVYNDITVNYVYPEHGSTKIPTNHKFILNFDQTITQNKIQNNVYITKDDGTIVNYSFDEYVSKAKNTFVIVPPGELDSNAIYHITINKGLISTENGMVKETQIFSFSTASGKDFTTPHGDHDEITKEVIKIYFVEHLNPLQIDKYTIRLNIEFGVDIESTVEYDFKNRCAILTPNTPLISGVNYEATYDGSIQDLAERVVGGDSYILFFF